MLFDLLSADETTLPWPGKRWRQQPLHLGGGEIPSHVVYVLTTWVQAVHRQWCVCSGAGGIG
jgi:hypothetical protein